MIWEGILCLIERNMIKLIIQWSTGSTCFKLVEWISPVECLRPVDVIQPVGQYIFQFIIKWTDDMDYIYIFVFVLGLSFLIGNLNSLSRSFTWFKTFWNILSIFRDMCMSLERIPTRRPIRVDQATSLVSRGKFARIWVEVDITKPLLAKFMIRRKARRIEYEGIHLICFNYGVYGPTSREIAAEQSRRRPLIRGWCLRRKDDEPLNTLENHKSQQKSRRLSVLGWWFHELPQIWQE